MPKTLKDFLEVYKPKSPDEQKFVDKHVVIKHKDRNGNGDDVFNAAKIKIGKRKEERHGYDVGEDEKVYEALKGDQHKIDTNKNGKIDAHDFHLLRNRKKKVAEEAEGLDEISKKLATSFLDKTEPKNDFISGGEGKQGHEKGRKLAFSKLARHSQAKVPANEEVTDPYDITGMIKRAKAKGDPNHPAMKHVAAIEDMKKTGGALSVQGDHVRSLKKALGEEVDIDAVLDEALDLLMSIDEKTLTPAEMKKREEVVKTIKRENPKMDKSMAYAIATKTAKRVAEDTEDLDESAKIAAHLIKRYGDNVRKSHVVSAANDFGVDASKLAKAVRSKLGKTTLAEEEDDGWYTHSQMHGSKKSEKHPKGISAAEWKSGIRWHHGKNKRINIKEELEELDELSATTKDAYAQKAGKQLTGLFKKSGSDADAARKYYNRKNTVRKIANEEVEELDELSAKKLTDYTAAASDALKHKKLSTTKLDKRYGSMALAHEKVRARHAKVAAEGYMPTADEPTETNKKTAQKVRDMMAKEKKPVKEDTQIDELSKNAMLKYLSANKKSDKAAQEKGDYSKSDKRMRGTDVAVRKYTASPNSKYVRVPATEEVEHIDELSKNTMGRYINRAKDSIDFAAYRQGAKGSTTGPLEKRLTKRHKGIETAVKKLTREESEHIDELSNKTMGSYINKAAERIGTKGVSAGLRIAADEKSSGNFKDMGKRQKGIARAVDKLTKEDVINLTIAKYVPEDLKYTPEERLLKRLNGLSEAHINTMLGLFEDLNKDNQNKMIETVSTEAGINQILNFVLENRGK